ncbi:MAG: hypothetical protein MUP47_07315 [Phycisphaerae bacterium]|nr:hypothetical protein [Phycisphaerae bacterium]
MVTQIIGTAAVAGSGFPRGGARLGPAERRGLSVQVLAGTDTVTGLAARHGVSRKFLYQQAYKASAALEDAFAPTQEDQAVLFHLPVTKHWIRQFVLGLALEGHSSFRGIRQLALDLLDYPDLSVGTIHNILQTAAGQARAVNQAQDLAGIRVGAHDEIYQAGRPVLVGADAKSTYCYLLSEEDHCDETTWGVRLLDLERQGLRPDYTVADGGLALRAGQAAAWQDVPCHGDVFHAERELGNLAFYLEHRASGCTSARQKLEHQMERRKRQGRGNQLSKRLAVARQAELQAVVLAGDVRILADWMRKDILSLSGPSLATRRELFDFVVQELSQRERFCPHRIGPLWRGLEGQRADLLAFAGVLDEEFADLAGQFDVPAVLVGQLCQLEALDINAPAYWQSRGPLLAKLGTKFLPLQQAVRAVMAETTRASSLVENLNSRLRNYFFLRRDLGSGYLDLLRFFLNHRRFPRSRCPQRVGHSPAELLNGRSLPHWLELLGFQRFHRN